MADDREFTFDRLSTPRPSYVVFRNGVKIAVASKSRGGRWGAAAMRSKVETSDHASRGDAARAIAELLDGAP